ncbi:uncharacterized protein Pyn_28005 [Prunus yedoensis var. nudiflora]|uniref:Uncharacterized protein n=1 Tax=Prunus yedoensis var. nudiflora TaxID=2094558 RepID=A0A314UFC2_PRUYE|nr:uncharacterized protein Pyn_28005 [Prunus yedoensis var. nudiflora]
MSWDFRAPGTSHPSYDRMGYCALNGVFYNLRGIVGEVVLQAKHMLAMSAFNKAKVLGGRYSIPTYSNGGLTKLNDDQDVIDMLVFVQETRLIDIFLHHGVDSNEDWFYSQAGSNVFVDLEDDIVPNRGVVIEELDDNYGAIVPVGGKGKQLKKNKKQKQVL